MTYTYWKVFFLVLKALDPGIVHKFNHRIQENAVSFLHILFYVVFNQIRLR
jgi:hypothetical protein